MMNKDLPKIGIIGGYGAMGAWFAKFFADAGFEVVISDIGTPLSNVELARTSRVIVISVPIGITTTVIDEIAPVIQQSHLLMDLTSIKSDIVPRLLETPAEVLSIHPMFGPHIQSFEGQVIVLCKARLGPLTETFEQLFIAHGAKVRDSTAEEHDRMMAVIQGLTHFQAIVSARCLQLLGVDIQESLAFASPVYRSRMVMIGRVLAQDPRLYAEIQTLNPHVGSVIDTLVNASNELATIVGRQDTSAFTALFEGAAAYLGEFKSLALKESNEMLRALQSVDSSSIAQDGKNKPIL